MRLLPEWSQQRSVMLTWPHQHAEWTPSLTIVEKCFVAIAKAITRFQALIIICYDIVHQKHVQALLKKQDIDLSRIHFYCAPSNDVWARDHGPILVKTARGPLLLDFIFNGWGNKYSAIQDNLISKQLHRLGAFENIPMKSIDMVLEGGSIEVDGHGTLLTTKKCLLNPNRNPKLTQTEIEDQLKLFLGIERILWLNNGALAGDDTDSHIDTLARFVDPYTICHIACDDPEDEHYADLQAMVTELQTFKNYQGQPYKLVALPWPKPTYSLKGDRLPNTYANFLIINNAVLMPTYRDPADQQALKVLQTCFPDREVIGIDCRDLIEQYGSLHCVTMQIGKLAPSNNLLR